MSQSKHHRLCLHTLCFCACYTACIQHCLVQGWGKTNEGEEKRMGFWRDLMKTPLREVLFEALGSEEIQRTAQRSNTDPALDPTEQGENIPKQQETQRQSSEQAQAPLTDT